VFDRPVYRRADQASKFKMPEYGCSAQINFSDLYLVAFETLLDNFGPGGTSPKLYQSNKELVI
jgi:hypothetical protein